MGIIEIILVSLGLDMDAFAVSVCRGLSMEKMNWKNALIIALYFGTFQALMPIIGYLLGSTFTNIITNIDYWIAFILLSIIGGNMIKGAFSKDEENEKDDSIDFKTMIALAIATSIDALAIGITFAFLKVNVWIASAIIGIITLLTSMIGVKIGHKFGDKFEHKAEIIGGIVLMLIGLKIVLEHFGIM